MFKQSFTQTLTAVIATVVLSATCLTAAVGPATPLGAGKTAVTLAAQAAA